MSKRIGPRMQEAVDYVRRNPGCAILPVAERVGPNGSRQYGYRTVHRAISAGLIAAKRSRGVYALTVPEGDPRTEEAAQLNRDANHADMVAFAHSEAA